MKRRCMVLLLAALLLSACSTVPTETTQPQSETTQSETTQPATTEATQPEEYMAPDFTMYTWDGTPVKLSDFRGKPTILNFWASWCGPCKGEMPDLEKAYLEYGDEINFLVVNLTDGTGETVDSAFSYIDSQGYTFPVYYDTAMDGAYAYGVNAIPVTYFIDASGNLVAYYEGAMSMEILQQGIGMIHKTEE